jgi:hypothetical protein
LVRPISAGYGMDTTKVIIYRIIAANLFQKHASVNMGIKRIKDLVLQYR